MSSHIEHSTVLSQLRADKKPVFVYLVNGLRLFGIITGFDKNRICLGPSPHQLISQHAISAIVPDNSTRMTQRICDSISWEI
jgi:host factor-I protein